MPGTGMGITQEKQVSKIPNPAIYISSTRHLYQSHSGVQLLSTVVLDVDRERNALSDSETSSWNSDANGQWPGLQASRTEHYFLRIFALFLQQQQYRDFAFLYIISRWTVKTNNFISVKYRLSTVIHYSFTTELNTAINEIVIRYLTLVPTLRVLEKLIFLILPTKIAKS